MTNKPDTPFIDFIMLADRAEAVNGKLYVMGGCWDQVSLPEFPAAYPFGLALRIVVTVASMESEHVVALKLEGPGEPEVQPTHLRFSRQAGIPAPDVERAQVVFGLNGLLTFTEPGAYVLEATLDDSNSRQVEFTVKAPPAG